MSIQVILTADNHLDPPVTQFGPKRLERRADYLRSFETLVNYALENKPDLLLISGDLYDSVEPRNPPRALMMNYFRKLHEKGIRIFLIGGHHDTPRSVEEGSSPLAVYGNSGYARFFQDTAPSHASLRIAGEDVTVYGMSYNRELLEGTDPLAGAKLEPTGTVNILMLHYSIEGFHGFYGSEPVVRASSIPTGFQLVAAGHLHRHQHSKIRDAAVIYPGSTERKTFLEEDEEKGFVWLELDRHGVLSQEFVKTPARKMKSLDFYFPTGGSVGELLGEELGKFADSELIFKVRVIGKIDPRLLSTYRRPYLLSRFSEKFFYLEFDEEKMDVQVKGTVEALPRTTPIQELRRYFEARMAEAKEEERQRLREAMALSERMLQEAGAW